MDGCAPPFNSNVYGPDRARVCFPTDERTTTRFGVQVHWFSIVNSLLIVLFLTAMIAMILIRNLHRDIMRYNRVPTDEEKAEEREETGWKVGCSAVGCGVTNVLSAYKPIPLFCSCFWSYCSKWIDRFIRTAVSRLGETRHYFQVVCPGNGMAVLKGWRGS